MSERIFEQLAALARLAATVDVGRYRDDVDEHQEVDDGGDVADRPAWPGEVCSQGHPAIRMHWAPRFGWVGICGREG